MCLSAVEYGVARPASGAARANKPGHGSLPAVLARPALGYLSLVSLACAGVSLQPKEKGEGGGGENLG